MPLVDGRDIIARAHFHLDDVRQRDKLIVLIPLGNCQSKLISNVNASASAEIKSSSQEPALVSIAYSLITPKSIARLPSP